MSKLTAEAASQFQSLEPASAALSASSTVFQNAARFPFITATPSCSAPSKSVCAVCGNGVVATTDGSGHNAARPALFHCVTFDGQPYNRSALCSLPLSVADLMQLDPPAPTPATPPTFTVGECCYSSLLNYHSLLHFPLQSQLHFRTCMLQARGSGKRLRECLVHAMESAEGTSTINR